MGWKREELVGWCVGRDALVLSSMWIVGVPVEVQVANGSIYTGICHTARFDKDYGIILRKAKLSGKEVECEEVLDTLVVSSCDIVQVVVKGILLPSQGLVTDDVDDVTSTPPQSSLFRSLAQHEDKSVSHLSNRTTSPLYVEKRENGCFPAKSFGSTLEGENVKVDSVSSAKTDEAPLVLIGPVIEGHVRKYQSEGKVYEAYEKVGSHGENDIHEVQLSNSGANFSLPQPQYCSEVHGCNTSSNDPTPSLLEPCTLDFERTTSIGSSMNVCCPSEKCVDMSCQLSTSQSASQTPQIATKDSFPCPSSKEFKLNPEAKTFMPMFSTTKSTALPSTVPTMDFISNDPSVIPVAVAPPVNAINSFAARSAAKFAPYNNMVAIDGDNAIQYSQSIVGHVGSRMHSVRYNSQCSPVQAGPAYIHPSSPAVMVGRLGQLVYMHPISHDLIQGSTVPPPVPIRPQLTSQILLPKHQASAAAAATGQALQVCVGQSGFVVGGGGQHQQPYALANGIPFSSQLSFHHPVRPIPTAHMTTNKFV